MCEESLYLFPGIQVSRKHIETHRFDENHYVSSKDYFDYYYYHVLLLHHEQATDT